MSIPKTVWTIGLAGGIISAAALLLLSRQPNLLPKVDSTSSTSQGTQKVVGANNEFTFALYSELNKSQRGNLLYSPYSISTVLAMAYEGAKGQTADEIRSVFRFPESRVLRANFAAIYNDINKGAQDYELKTGNALWVQQDLPLLADYTSRIRKYYGGKAANVDFAKQTEKSRQTINSYIEEQTKNKIRDLIPEGSLDAMTRLILTNAIYFKGTWQWEFDTSNTRDEDFKVTPDNLVKTPMMTMNPDKASFNYADTGDLQILELPYKGDKLSMLVLLPTKDLDSIEGSLRAKELNKYKSKMKETKLDSISLPKFKLDTKYSMEDALSSMGMPTSFSYNADFSGITGKKDLLISSVIHQAHVNVDEKGTEAAAATAVTLLEKTSLTSKKAFTADHPFIFIIQQKSTGNILFLGRVVNPTS